MKPTAPLIAVLFATGSVALAGCSGGGDQPISAGVAEQRYEAITGSALTEDLDLPPEAPFSFQRESCDDLPWADQDIDGLLASVGVDRADRFQDITTAAQVEELRRYLAGAVAYAVAVCPGSEQELIALIGQMNRRGFGGVTDSEGRVLTASPIDSDDAMQMTQIADDLVGRGDQ